MPFERLEKSGHDVVLTGLLGEKSHPGSFRNSERRRQTFGPDRLLELRHEAIRGKEGQGKHPYPLGNSDGLWNSLDESVHLCLLKCSILPLRNFLFLKFHWQTSKFDLATRLDFLRDDLAREMGLARYIKESELKRERTRDSMLPSLSTWALWASCKVLASPRVSLRP